MSDSETKVFFSWRTALLSTNLDAKTKLTALVISTHMNDWGTGAWPSQETIAALGSMSIRSVGAAVKNLEDAGWLTRAKRRQPGKTWALTHYEINFPPGFKLPAGGAGSKNDAGTTNAGEGSRGPLEQPAGAAGSTEQPANIAEQPATDSNNDRQELPTNSPENSPIDLKSSAKNAGRKKPKKTYTQRAEVTRGTTDTTGLTEKPEAEAAGLRKMIKQLPDKSPMAEALQTQVEKLEARISHG